MTPTVHVPLAIFLIRHHVASASPLLPVSSPASAGLWVRIVGDAQVESTPANCITSSTRNLISNLITAAHVISNQHLMPVAGAFFT